MQIPISPEIRDALSAHPGEPIELMDAQSSTSYVLVPRERYDQLRTLLSSDSADIRDTYAAQSEALHLAGWDDKSMDIYNDYDANKS